jgi:hypothetical protein
MERLRQLVGEANLKLKKADHLTYMTYPLVNEIKLLYTITENIHDAVISAMEAVLHYDRLYKRIDPRKGDFEYELELFKDSCAMRYNIDRSFMVLIKDLKRIVEAKRKSPMEFVRKDKFVICTENYKMQVLNIQKVKDFLSTAKRFVGSTNKAVRWKG